VSSSHVDPDHHHAVLDAQLAELRQQDPEELGHHVDLLPHVAPAHHHRIAHQEAEDLEENHWVEVEDVQLLPPAPSLTPRVWRCSGAFAGAAEVVGQCR